MINERKNLIGFTIVVATTIAFYLASIHIPSPYLATDANVLYWGAIFQILAMQLYPAADIGYLLAIFICIWKAGRYRWLMTPVILSVCFLGLGRFHADIVHGGKACYLNAAFAGIIAFATIPIAQRVSATRNTIGNFSILDLFVLVTIAGTIIAYVMHNLALVTDPKSDWWPYTPTTVLEQSVQAVLNTLVAITAALFCLRPKTWLAPLVVLFVSLLRWCHTFVSYDDESGISIDLSPLDLELLSEWWMQISIEPLFLMLCIMQMWRMKPTKRTRTQTEIELESLSEYAPSIPENLK